MPPKLPNKATWREFKASRHDFEEGRCEHGRHAAEKLFWHGGRFVCAACRGWLKKYGQNGEEHN
jgi:hypothetical protein